MKNFGRNESGKEKIWKKGDFEREEKEYQSDKKWQETKLENKEFFKWKKWYEEDNKKWAKAKSGLRCGKTDGKKTQKTLLKKTSIKEKRRIN